MFTGIVAELGTVTNAEKDADLLHLTVQTSPLFLQNLKLGASIAVNGACLTVTKQANNRITFDVIQETLQKTNLESLKEGDHVNLERSLQVGDELGGHLVSGHVHGVAVIENIENGNTLTLSLPQEFAKYIFPKGFIALNGVSLTIVSIDDSRFSVSLIPETLSRTTFGNAKIGDHINFEVDQQTRTIVDTLKRLQF